MTTIQKTITIPANHRLHLDLAVPEVLPQGQTRIIVHFMPVQVNENPDLREVKTAQHHEVQRDAELEAVIRDAQEMTAWRLAHPAEYLEKMEQCREGGPLFGRVDAVEYQRKIRDEWNRI